MPRFVGDFGDIRCEVRRVLRHLPQLCARSGKYYSGMHFAIFFTFFILPCIAGAQLVTPTTVPTGSIPVVFLDGYQLGCTGDSSFKSNFGSADTVLQASHLVTLYFDNCS